jgi:hypothetical protein
MIVEPYLISQPKCNVEQDAVVYSLKKEEYSDNM